MARLERRRLTVLFADIRGFTRFCEENPIEEAALALKEVDDLLRSALEGGGGMIVKLLGDGVMAVFASEENAVRAALEAEAAMDRLALRRIEEGREPLRLGMGLNTGEVLAGYVGPTGREEFDVLGMPVNIAARLEKAAAPGQLLAGGETRRALGDRFASRELEPLPYHHVTHPVRVFELS